MSNLDGLLGLAFGVGLYVGIATVCTVVTPIGWVVWVLAGPLIALLLVGMAWIVQDMVRERRWRRQRDVRAALAKGDGK